MGTVREPFCPMSVTGGRRSTGASGPARPSATTPITATPTAPPPSTASPVWRRSAPGSGCATGRRAERARGREQRALEVVRRRVGAGEPGQLGLDPALALDQVAAGVAGVDVGPGPLRLGRGQLAVEERADARAEVADHAAPAPAPRAADRWPGRRSGPGPRLRRAVGQRRAEHGAAAVDAGADGAELDAEDVGDLLVAEALDVAEHDGRPEVRGQGGQGAPRRRRRRSWSA